MFRSAARFTLTAFLTMALVLVGGGYSSADPTDTFSDEDVAEHQHGGAGGHLPATSENVRLVGKVRVHDAVANRIGDVGTYGNYAYLAKYAGTCSSGGTYVIDISDPRNPREVGLIPGHQDSYTGEGVQVVHIETAAFKGEILLQNFEQCGKNGKGGVSLWNVTNPLKPVKLVENIGDFTGAVLGDHITPNPNNKNTPHDASDVHSAFIWQQGSRAYLVAVDDLEALDVDILDITNPKKPVLIRETGLPDWPAAQNAQSAGMGNFSASFFHDVVVKQINGNWIMLLSYWDAGWVKLNVNDPANPVFIAHSDYPVPDTLLPAFGPEGNAHQAEFSRDNKYIVGTDEDFSPYRTSAFRITTGPNAGEYPSTAVGGAAAVATLSDRRLNGPTVYGGYGCPASAPIPPASSFTWNLQPGEEKIAVLQRGPAGDPSAPEEACFPGEKAANAIAAGYDAVVLVARHISDPEPLPPFCGSGAFPPDRPIVAVCTTHDAFHKMFNTTTDFTLPYPPEPNNEPNIGAQGERVDVTSVFDGWGYVRLLDANTMRQIGAYAVTEALDERFAQGFGDLSVHEVATDPDRNIGYLSYYQAGFRVIKFGPGGITEVGRFIDQGGNNFWGVEITRIAGEKYVLASDMDFGLYIFQYTGR